MEQFLETRGLPLNYPKLIWTGLYVGVDSIETSYSGEKTSTGTDLGPASWCADALVGMTSEMHHRLHIQRIEAYSIAGFIVGSIGILIGIVSILI